ncbi:MAG TPA: hypothetical protein VEI28_00305 [Thermodesulfovibrionales bacterium]|nr:hypothetical protein [Thermodesulfovibrionales bacterium]
MKKGFYFGCLCGGILGVIVALSMDLVLGGALGSGWREAVAHDLGALTGKTLGINSAAVLAGVAVVIGIIGGFGALVGGVFGVMLARLFSFLTKGDET